jgi:hypothetical protein
VTAAEGQGEVGLSRAAKAFATLDAGWRTVTRIAPRRVGELGKPVLAENVGTPERPAFPREGGRVHR